MPAEPLPTEQVLDAPVSYRGADAPGSPDPDREISLEEWIAAGQACCGAGPAE